MIHREIVEKVQNGFSYLFNEYGYQVAAYSLFDNSGNWLVILQSVCCGRMLVLQDRGEVIVALGPQAETTEGPWFDLAVVLEYLSQGQQMLERSLGDPDRQISRLAGELRPYMRQVSTLFVGPAFESARADLDFIGERREEEIWRDPNDDGYNGPYLN